MIESMSSDKTQVIIAGHGGQGVLELANCISYYEILKGRHVAQTPSYGPETRGGKVKCFVVISDGEIDSPIVEEPDHLIVMNARSMEHVNLLRIGGMLLINSSLITEEPSRNDVITFKVPATAIADGLKGSIVERIQDTKIAANSVIFGSYLSFTNQKLDLSMIRDVFNHFLLEKKAAYLELDLLGVKQGYEFAENQTRRSAKPSILA
jgi:2-oxoglutarate ferredoxin oxidoreductase subunit gamma